MMNMLRLSARPVPPFSRAFEAIGLEDVNLGLFCNADTLIDHGHAHIATFKAHPDDYVLASRGNFHCIRRQGAPSLPHRRVARPG